MYCVFCDVFGIDQCQVHAIAGENYFEDETASCEVLEDEDD